jgi:hypothetical protein
MYCRGNPVNATDPNGMQMDNQEEEESSSNNEIPINQDQKAFISRRLSDEKVKAIAKNSWRGVGDNLACHQHASKGAIAASKIQAQESKGKVSVLLGATHAIAISAIYGKENIEKAFKGDETLVTQQDIVVDEESAYNAISYIKKSIDAGLPAMIGVNVAKESQLTFNRGEVTDHFLNIIGYEEIDGKIISFSAIDNAVSNGKEILLYVEQETGKIYKEEDNSSNYTGYAYQVDQVRLWDTIAPDSNDGVGHLMPESDRRRTRWP